MKKYRILFISFIILICLSACKNEAENVQPQEVVQEETKPPVSTETEQEQEEETIPEEPVEEEVQLPEEPVAEEVPQTAQALDLSAYDLQYGQHEEFLKIYDQRQPVEQAESFEGTWHRTDTASGLGAELTISEQTADGFSFYGDFWYYSHSGYMDGTAYFAAPNVAVFEYINDWGIEGTVPEYLVFEKTGEGMKLYASAASADLGFGMNVFADGNYTQGEPVYENANVLNDNFSAQVQEQMQTLLGENYDEFFKFPTETGILTATPATLEDGSSAIYYDVFVPTMGGYEFQMLVCENGDVYFNSGATMVGFQSTVAGATEFPVYELAESN